MKQFEILLESRADKLALRFLKERGITDYNEQMRIIGAIKHDIPNLRLDNSKFVLGALRIYYDNQLSDAQSLGALDKALKYIHIGGHKDEYDENLNGKSLEELSEMFSDIAKQYSDSDRQRSANQQFSGGGKYTIIPIESYEEAQKYSEYTSWCVTQSKQSFDAYTAQGQKFYFCLMNGFEDVHKNDDGAPLNEYGLSMISVLVDCDGDLERVTTRYNHDYNGENNKGLETPGQLEKVLNVPFYQTFKPYTEEELEAKGMSIKDEIGEAELSGLKKITKNIIERYPRLKKCVIPNSVTSIEKNAFHDCTGLTSITIPASVTSIGNYAFHDCTGLTSITIPNSVTSIGNYAFDGCTRLTSITIPASVTSIGNGAFYGCTGLTSITIPASVTSIGRYAFHDCTGLTSITIPNSVTSIGNYAFDGCTRLTSITIPASVTSIGRYAFDGCTRLTSITIPASVTSIGRYAFHDCTGLTSITIPNSVTSIGFAAFCGCTGITSITIPNSVTEIGNYAFAGCTGLTSITIPNSVTSIGDWAFCNCSGLTSVTIPNSVTSIGDWAFYNCSGLTSITIPNSVIGIGYGAFTVIDVVYYSGSTTGAPWGAKRVLPYNNRMKECITMTTNSLRKTINEIVNKLI